MALLAQGFDPSRTPPGDGEAAATAAIALPARIPVEGTTDATTSRDPAAGDALPVAIAAPVAITAPVAPPATFAPAPASADAGYSPAAGHSALPREPARGGAASAAAPTLLPDFRIANEDAPFVPAAWAVQTIQPAAPRSLHTSLATAPDAAQAGGPGPRPDPAVRPVAAPRRPPTVADPARLPDPADGRVPAGESRQAEAGLPALESTANNATSAPSPAATALPPAMAAPRPDAARHAIAVPVGHADFGAAAAEKVTWLVVRGVEHAQLAVNPPELGPIEAHITIDNGEATIRLLAASAEARAALAESLPHLATRLAEGGITLAQASVSGDGGTGRDPAPPGQRPHGRQHEAGAEGSARPVLVARARAGLVDDFA